MAGTVLQTGAGVAGQLSGRRPLRHIGAVGHADGSADGCTGGVEQQLVSVHLNVLNHSLKERPVGELENVNTLIHGNLSSPTPIPPDWQTSANVDHIAFQTTRSLICGRIVNNRTIHGKRQFTGIQFEADKMTFSVSIQGWGLEHLLIAAQNDPPSQPAPHHLERDEGEGRQVGVAEVQDHGVGLPRGHKQRHVQGGGQLVALGGWHHKAGPARNTVLEECGWGILWKHR